MKNENLKKLAGELISKSKVDNGLEIINDAQSSKIKGGLAKDITDLTSCTDTFKCRNGFSCQSF